MLEKKYKKEEIDDEEYLDSQKISLIDSVEQDSEDSEST